MWSGVADGAMEKVDASPNHFVGSLVPSHNKDLLEIPRDEKNYQPLEVSGTREGKKG